MFEHWALIIEHWALCIVTSYSEPTKKPVQRLSKTDQSEILNDSAEYTDQKYSVPLAQLIVVHFLISSLNHDFSNFEAQFIIIYSIGAWMSR